VNTLLGHASHKESAYEYGRSLVEQIEGFAHELELEKVGQSRLILRVPTHNRLELSALN